MKIKSVCVYCGSNFGSRPEYKTAAEAMGRAIGERCLRLVYGGGQVGLMGIVADAAMAAGAEVHGVIPEFIAIREVAHHGLTKLDVVSSMHERKALMAEHADAFIAMPGGLGTMEELFEMWTWSQLGQHGKPCGLLEVGDYYDGLVAFLDRMAADGFVAQNHRDMLIARDDPHSLLEAFESYVAPEADIRLKVEQT